MKACANRPKPHGPSASYDATEELATDPGDDVCAGQVSSSSARMGREDRGRQDSSFLRSRDISFERDTAQGSCILAVPSFSELVDLIYLDDELVLRHRETTHDEVLGSRARASLSPSTEARPGKRRKAERKMPSPCAVCVCVSACLPVCLSSCLPACLPVCS